MGPVTSVAMLCVLASLALTPRAHATSGVTTLVSVSSTGEQANSGSLQPDMSADGRFVAFTSTATNLVAGDSFNSCSGGGCFEVFVHDRQTGLTESVSGNAVGGNNSSPSISYDGRIVAFSSDAALVPDDDNRWLDMYVRDRETGALERIATALTEPLGGGVLGEGPWLSGNGNLVAFASAFLPPSEPNGAVNLFVYDRTNGTTSLASVDEGGSPSNGNTIKADLSEDGRFVAFISDATDLVPVDANGRSYDVFVRDMQAGTTELVSVDSSEVQASDGSWEVSISGDGRYVAFAPITPEWVANPNNGQLFLRDRQAETTEMISMAPDGTEGDQNSMQPSISVDGRFVAFRTEASNLTTAFSPIVLWDRVTGEIEPIAHSTQPPSSFPSFTPVVSRDGASVAYMSLANDLVTCDTNLTFDIFVHNRLAEPSPASTPIVCPLPSQPIPVSNDFLTPPPVALPDGGGPPQALPPSQQLVVVLPALSLLAATAVIWASRWSVRR